MKQNTNQNTIKEKNERKKSENLFFPAKAFF